MLYDHGNMTSFKQRVDQLGKLLAEEEIDLKQLRLMCFQGIPDTPSLRSLSWKILLNYVPLCHSEWAEFLQKQRRMYRDYVEEIVAHPDTSEEDSSVDHPLNTHPDSQWITYFKDNESLLQIDRDVRRLCPDLSFFQNATQYTTQHILKTDKPFETLTNRVERAMLESSEIGTSRGGLKNVTIKKCRNEEYNVLPDGQEAHWQVVERILFIYAKLNPGIGYVQGMNEIIGPLYYVFASDPDTSWQEHCEADTFFCFSHLMGEVRDHFIKKLDDSSVGIGNTMNRLLCLLQIRDPELWTNLDKKNMKPQFFAFRWITLLLSQEFHLPDVIRLWDSLFADPDRFQFLIDVCCAMLIIVRDRILDMDFARTMKLVQNFPHDEYDMSQIIRKAVEIRTLPPKGADEVIGNEADRPQAKVTGRAPSSRAQSLKSRLSRVLMGDSS